MATTHRPTATARIISRSPGGYTDQFESTLSVLNENGIWIGERTIAGRLLGRPFRVIGDQHEGLDSLSAVELDAIEMALTDAEHAGEPV